MARKAMEKANDPKTRRQIDDARQKLARRRGGSGGAEASPAPEHSDPGPSPHRATHDSAPDAIDAGRDEPPTRHG